MCRNGVCKNTPGSYICDCRLGFSVKDSANGCTGNAKFHFLTDWRRSLSWYCCLRWRWMCNGNPHLWYLRYLHQHNWIIQMWLSGRVYYGGTQLHWWVSCVQFSPFVCLFVHLLFVGQIRMSASMLMAAVTLMLLVWTYLAATGVFVMRALKGMATTAEVCQERTSCFAFSFTFGFHSPQIHSRCGWVLPESTAVWQWPMFELSWGLSLWMRYGIRSYRWQSRMCRSVSIQILMHHATNLIWHTRMELKWWTFSDINECEMFRNLCVNGECVNIFGLFRCDCMEGYQLDITGGNCTGKSGSRVENPLKTLSSCCCLETSFSRHQWVWESRQLPVWNMR